MSDVVQMWSTHFGTVELGQWRGAGFRDWGAGGRMVYPISHASANGDSYRVVVKGHVFIAKVSMSCYLQGSPTGGFGTECSHVVESGALPTLAQAMGEENISVVLGILESATDEYWRNFHQEVMKVQNESFVWFETDWDD